VLGLGMGMVFQVYLVAMQNSIRPQDMGSATATVQFFRSMGATFGVGAFGTVFITRLTSQLVQRIGPVMKTVNINALVNSPKPLRTTSNLSAALSSEMTSQSEEGAQEAAEATHAGTPPVRTGRR